MAVSFHFADKRPKGSSYQRPCNGKRLEGFEQRSDGTLTETAEGNSSSEEEKKKRETKWLVQRPNSYIMDVKCPGCSKIITVLSRAQTVALCGGRSAVSCQPTGGKARLTEGCSFRRKQH
ncbi:40S ribosomal protein S27-like [Panthera uncia]|uniref:40S ribosomal protein S27-like n=1 Tax=Panthera uncia TaxID=29064 RepID=UPI0020FFF246|nr:40S ribosomal protein S27-like [Panthera uncia]